MRQEHEPKAEPRWGIGGQRVMSQMRGYSKVERMVLKRLVKYVH